MEFKAASRNLFRRRRRTILTGSSMVGGFFLAAVFIGWSDGTYNGIIDRFTRTQLGHIQIHAPGWLDRPTLYKTIDDLDRVAAALRETRRVESWAPRVYGSGLASVGDRSTGVRIIGTDPAREAAATGFDRKIVRGKAFAAGADGGAVLGEGLAEVLRAELGDEVVLLSQAADGSIANALYLATGILSSGDTAGDRMSLYLPLTEAQEFFALGGAVHEVAVIVEGLKAVGGVDDTLSERLTHLAVAPWQVFARSFYEAMQADKAGMWVTLVVIVVIVAVGVLNTVLMSVLERRREYGLLKALGTRPGRIVSLVLIEVALLAAASVALGSGLGLAANAWLAGHGIDFGIEFTYGGMEFGVMRSEVNLRSFLIPAATVLAASMLVSIFPAVKAARTEPAKTMRSR